MACEEVKSQKYQTRKSPPFHARECKNLTKKGKDGDYISKADAKGIYKWVKVSANKTRKVPKGAKSYLTHDNGSRPFRVEVSGKDVEIYRGYQLPDGIMEYDELVKKLTVKEVHVGQSPCNSAIYISDACGTFGKGNSILAHLGGNKYMFVGDCIYEFSMDDDFEAYYSVIGNNDVPYPVTIGSKYVYMMLDRIFIPKDLFKAKMNSAEWADAYAYYYGFKDFETGEEINCFKKYGTRAKQRKACEKEAKERHKELIKGADKKMKGLKVIRERGV
jgi:hypothetical protein